MKSRSTTPGSTLRIKAYTIDEDSIAKLRQMATRNDMSMSQVLRFLVKQSPLILRNKKGQMVKGKSK